MMAYALLCSNILVRYRGGAEDAEGAGLYLLVIRAPRVFRALGILYQKSKLPTDQCYGDPSC